MEALDKLHFRRNATPKHNETIVERFERMFPRQALRLLRDNNPRIRFNVDAEIRRFEEQEK